MATSLSTSGSPSNTRFPWKGKERKEKERKGKERKGKERKGKERKGKERKGKERKGKERKSIYQVNQKKSLYDLC